MPKARRAGSKLERISRPFSDGCPGVCPGLPKPIFPPDWDSFKDKRQKNYGNRNHKNNNTPFYIPSLTGCEEASTSTGLSEDSGLVAADIISCLHSSSSTSESSPNRPGQRPVGSNTINGISGSTVGRPACNFPVSPPSMSMNKRRKYEARRAQKDAEYRRLLGKVQPTTPEPVQPTVSHEKLCPFCDKPLPEKPTAQLSDLIQMCKINPKGFNDPQPWNKYHIWLPLGITAETCRRHDLESEHIFDREESKAWPLAIDFATLPNRIWGLKSGLLRLCANPGDSPFWRHVKEGYDKYGSSTLGYLNVARQNPALFMNGYFGQRGGVIIKRTLDLVFHRTTAYTTFFPLTFDSFIDYVLRPEVGVRLLMEDFKCAWEEALEIWSASGTYGELQFPYRDDDPIVGQLHNALNSIN